MAKQCIECVSYEVCYKQPYADDPSCEYFNEKPTARNAETNN